jgi:hypothetical protein
MINLANRKKSAGPSFNDDNVPFDVLMKQAADLKTAQLAENRRRYDAWDSWYRNSLFARDVRAFFSSCFFHID